MVAGWLSRPENSVSGLCRAAASQAVAISPQGLDQRFTEPAADFMKAVVELAISQVLSAEQQVDWRLLQRFKHVYLQDSTQLSLPPELAEIWAGSGGSGSKAALKIDFMYDLNTGECHVELRDGKAADNRSTLLERAVAPGSVHIKDLGYFKLERFAEQAARGEYWLSRLAQGTKIFTAPDVDQALDVAAYLLCLARKQQRLAEQALYVGAETKLPARFIAVRLSEASAARNRAQLKDKQAKKGRTPSAQQLALCDWWLLITNIPAEQLSTAEAPNLYGVRWQVELIFKLWKSYSKLAASRSKNPYRILCEIYVKLLIVLLQHWVFLIGFWQISRRSLVKGVQAMQEQAFVLVNAIGDLAQLLDALERITRILRSAGCVQNKRKKKPSTWQRMEEVGALDEG